MSYADRPGAAQQHGQQVAAGRQRVVEIDRLAGEEKRLVEVEARINERLRAEALSIRDRRVMPSLVPLLPGDGAGDGGEHEQHDGGEEESPQPAVRPPLPGRLLLGNAAACVQEVAFELVELLGVLAGPLERAGEARAAVQLTWVASRPVPLACSLRQVPVKEATLRVLLEPTGEPRPPLEQ